MQYVFSDNVIEHIPLAAGRAMLEQAHRSMQPGGVIRLVTPDIKKHVELYLAGDSVLDGDVAKEYRDMGLVVEHSIDLIRIPIGSFGHHEGYVYDFQVLEAELKRAGFHSVVQVRDGRERARGAPRPSTSGSRRKALRSSSRRRADSAVHARRIGDDVLAVGRGRFLGVGLGSRRRGQARREGRAPSPSRCSGPTGRGDEAQDHVRECREREQAVRRDEHVIGWTVDQSTMR